MAEYILFGKYKAITNKEQKIIVECYKNDYLPVYSLLAKIKDGDEKVAYCNFKLNNKKECSLIDICVSNVENRNKGIATLLLQFMECIAYQNYAKNVFGKFYPHEDDKINVEKFYEKNGYIVDREVMKHLDYNKISKPNLVDIDIFDIDFNEHLYY